MSSSSRRTWWILLILLLALLTGAGWWVAGEVRAWRHYRAGKVALDADDLESAREHFAQCMKAWPQSGEVRFLAARVERKSGELGPALRLLKQATELGWVEEAIDLERSLIRVQAGELRQQERYLLYCLENDHPDRVLILEILVPAYLRNFQLAHADKLVDEWLELRPDNPKAWKCRAAIDFRRRNIPRAITAYQRVLELDPGDRTARAQLVELLLEKRKYPEAQEHLVKLLDANPNDRGTLLLQARLKMGRGDHEQARKLLDGLRRQGRPDAQVLHLRGQVEMDDNHPDRAEPFLQQAVALAPTEHEYLYTLFLCLRRQMKNEEAEKIQKRWQECKDALARLVKIAQQIPGKPNDPELRRQAGEISLKYGREEDGLRWLNSALEQDATHAATHRTLAEYYEKKGRHDLAEAHRRRARPPERE